MDPRTTEQSPSTNPDIPDEEPYEPPRLESHGKLADITGTRQFSGADMSQGTRGPGDG